jgi:hypothetical protein
MRLVRAIPKDLEELERASTDMSDYATNHPFDGALKPRDLARACSGGRFIVHGAAEAYDAHEMKSKSEIPVKMISETG